MAVNGKFTAISRADLLAVADRFGIGTAAKTLHQIGEAIRAWPDFASRARVSPKETTRIQEHHLVYPR
jgi:serine/threonine-protein kinase HipA